VSPAFNLPRGTHDVLPENHAWWHIVRAIEAQTARYGWRRIQTPGFEETELFQRTSGAASDVVHKEMYTFEDRSGRSLTLRPEGTAPVARAYVEHGMAKEPQPVKLYTIAPMYRYGRPGRGRYREHWQLSLEAIGSADPAIDAEVIQFYSELLRELGVSDWELRLNSIGDANCRPQYVARLNEWLDAHPELVDDEVAHKRATSVLQVFDVKNEQLRAALDDAPKIGESLCDACREHFDAVRSWLDLYGVPYVLDPTLVRGLDYYTRTTFEFIGPEENVNSTICGGGRYDGLIEQVGGPATPGIGFGAGLERLQIALERERPPVEPQLLDVVLVTDDDALRGDVLRTLAELRLNGVAADTDYGGRSMKGQLTQAQKRANAVAIRTSNGWTLRRRGEQDRSAPTLKEIL
jgi:histidyl-tRNA synthetase